MSFKPLNQIKCKGALHFLEKCTVFINQRKNFNSMISFLNLNFLCLRISGSIWQQDYAIPITFPKFPLRFV